MRASNDGVKGSLAVKALKRFRKAKTLSLADVADRTGLLPPAVARAEREGTDPRFSTVAAIAKAMDVPLCELVEDDQHGKHRRRTKR